MLVRSHTEHTCGVNGHARTNARNTYTHELTKYTHERTHEIHTLTLAGRTHTSSNALIEPKQELSYIKTVQRL